MTLKLVDNSKTYFVLGILCLFGIKSFAHSPNEAYFTINFQGDSCWVEAEFPWAFRNAIEQEFPYLKEEKSSEIFQESIQKYLNQYFILKKDGQVLDFQVVQLKGSHTHSVKFAFGFYIKAFQKIDIQNTCMFNLYKNQTNYHTIYWEDKVYQVETNVKQTSFTFDKNPEKSKDLKPSYHALHYSIIIFLILLVSIFILKSFYKK